MSFVGVDAKVTVIVLVAVRSTSANTVSKVTVS